MPAIRKYYVLRLLAVTREEVVRLLVVRVQVISGHFLLAFSFC
jgi:hypothetical protein